MHIDVWKPLDWPGQLCMITWQKKMALQCQSAECCGREVLTSCQWEGWTGSTAPNVHLVWVKVGLVLNLLLLLSLRWRASSSSRRTFLSHHLPPPVFPTLPQAWGILFWLWGDEGIGDGGINEDNYQGIISFSSKSFISLFESPKPGKDSFLFYFLWSYPLSASELRIGGMEGEER